MCWRPADLSPLAMLNPASPNPMKPTANSLLTKLLKHQAGRKHKDTNAAWPQPNLSNWLRRGYSAPGRGGVDAPSRRCREATFEGAAGVVSSAKTSARRSDHPVCAASVAARLFLNGAATPPVPGGEYPRLPNFADPHNPMENLKRTNTCGEMTAKNEGQ